MRPRINTELYGDIILLRLYDNLVAEKSYVFSRGSLFSEFPDVGRNLLEVCLDGLKDDNLVRVEVRQDYSLDVVKMERVPYTRTDVYISRAGVSHVEAWSEDYYTKVRTLLADKRHPPDVRIPASNRTVTLNHNQTGYQNAINALDKVLEEYSNDHRLDNELGPRKDAISKILEGGRRLLDDKEVSVDEAESWLIKPLKWIVDKFTQGALQAAASKALDLVLKLIG